MVAALLPLEAQLVLEALAEGGDDGGAEGLLAVVVLVVLVVLVDDVVAAGRNGQPARERHGVEARRAAATACADGGADD